MLSERQKMLLKSKGIDVEKTENISNQFIENMKEEGVNLAEAKYIAQRMACILKASETYRPNTELKEIPIVFP